MSGEPSGGSSDGPATDRHNEPVEDPTGNVYALVKAAIQRQDDLRTLESDHIRELLAMRSSCAEEIGALKSALADEKFAGVKREQNLIESHRIELKGDSEKALTAALSAQKEAAAEQNKSNTLAIDKAVSGMKELIVNNYQISQATTNALSDKVEDLKSSVAMLVNTKVEAREQKQEQRAISGGMVALVSVGSGILFSTITLMITLMVR